MKENWNISVNQMNQNYIIDVMQRKKITNKLVSKNDKVSVERRNRFIRGNLILSHLRTKNKWD